MSATVNDPLQPWREACPQALATWSRFTRLQDPKLCHSRMQAAAAEVNEGRDGAEIRFHQADVDFHEALALASGNRVLSYLFEGMASPLRESFYATRRGQQLRGLSLADSVAVHTHILACVSSGDAKGAAEAMSKLIDDAERDIRAAYGPSALP